ncbi:CsbD family protein [Henriciella sp.]|uniref:CsbD family protein n=1 Tax=Henriciella sp. TaxID=1968823 RepID=UPI0026068F6A|nr:CsbD family protein [Henriciella sp.]
MGNDKAKGLGKQVEGKAKEVAGVASGDRKLEAEGKGQETVGKVKDEIKKSEKENENRRS